MIEYANERVTKSLKQYDMLLKSLKYIPSNEEKTAIYYQMTKITEQILALTNEVYERHIIEVGKSQSTSKKFPRNYGQIKKKPL